MIELAWEISRPSLEWKWRNIAATPVQSSIPIVIVLLAVIRTFVPSFVDQSKSNLSTAIGPIAFVFVAGSAVGVALVGGFRLVNNAPSTFANQVEPSDAWVAKEGGASSIDLLLSHSNHLVFSFDRY